MVRYDEPTETRMEYCLDQLEERVVEMERIPFDCRKSERAIRLACEITYWDKMITLAEIGMIRSAKAVSD